MKKVTTKEFKAAVQQWLLCKRPSLRWLSGDHCRHCTPLKDVLRRLAVLG